jgi:hypothetical protein
MNPGHPPTQPLLARWTCGVAEQQRDELVVGWDGAGTLQPKYRGGAVDEREPLRGQEPPLLGAVTQGGGRRVRQLARLRSAGVTSAGPAAARHEPAAPCPQRAWRVWGAGCGPRPAACAQDVAKRVVSCDPANMPPSAGPAGLSEGHPPSSSGGRARMSSALPVDPTQPVSRNGIEPMRSSDLRSWDERDDPDRSGRRHRLQRAAALSALFVLHGSLAWPGK